MHKIKFNKSHKNIDLILMSLMIILIAINIILIIRPTDSLEISKDGKINGLTVQAKIYSK